MCSPDIMRKSWRIFGKWCLHIGAYRIPRLNSSIMACLVMWKAWSSKRHYWFVDSNPFHTAGLIILDRFLKHLPIQGWIAVKQSKLRKTCCHEYISCVAIKKSPAKPHVNFDQICRLTLAVFHAFQQAFLSS